MQKIGKSHQNPVFEDKILEHVYYFKIFFKELYGFHTDFTNI